MDIGNKMKIRRNTDIQTTVSFATTRLKIGPTKELKILNES